MTRDDNNGINWALLVGDWLVLLLFVFIGQRDHQMSGPGVLASLLTTTAAIALPWTAAAWLFGVYRPTAWPNLSAWFGRCLAAWLVAAPLGLLIRALVRGQGAIPLPFMLVMLGLGGLFVVGWRLLAWWWLTRRGRAAATG